MRVAGGMHDARDPLPLPPVDAPVRCGSWKVDLEQVFAALAASQIRSDGRAPILVIPDANRRPPSLAQRPVDAAADALAARPLHMSAPGLGAASDARSLAFQVTGDHAR